MRRPRQVRGPNSASAQCLRRGPIENSYAQDIHRAVLRWALTLHGCLSGSAANDLRARSAGRMALQYPMLWFLVAEERYVGVNEAVQRVSTDSGAIRSRLVRLLKGGAFPASHCDTERRARR